MSLEAGYTARWHLLNGLPVPQGPPLAFVLDAIAPKLGALPSTMEQNEDAQSEGVPPIEPIPTPTPKVYRDIELSTPNKGGTLKPLGIVLHSTYGAFAGSLSWIRNAASKVSYHTLIEPNGNRHHVVPFNRVAWHAGVSSFRGRSGCNSFMVGIAWEGNLYRRQLSEDEIESAAQLCARLMREHKFTLDWVTDHRTVSPGRKEDIPPAVLALVKSRIAQLL